MEKKFKPSVLVYIEWIMGEGLSYHQAWDKWFQAHGITEKIKPNYNSFDWSI